jgi:hypothetical protein
MSRLQWIKSLQLICSGGRVGRKFYSSGFQLQKFLSQLAAPLRFTAHEQGRKARIENSEWKIGSKLRLLTIFAMLSSGPAFNCVPEKAATGFITKMGWCGGNHQCPVAKRKGETVPSKTGARPAVKV